MGSKGVRAGLGGGGAPVIVVIHHFYCNNITCYNLAGILVTVIISWTSCWRVYCCYLIIVRCLAKGRRVVVLSCTS
jgi:hypothetical protein